MNTLLYFVVMAACMLLLSQILPGFHVAGWVPALIGAVVMGVLNAVLKPILFVLTLPFILVTLGLFLFVLNAIILWLTAMLVPGFVVVGFIPTLLASLFLSAVGVVWRAATEPPKKEKD